MGIAEKPWPVFDSKYFLGLLFGGMNLALNGFLVNLKPISKEEEIPK